MANTTTKRVSKKIKTAQEMIADICNELNLKRTNSKLISIDEVKLLLKSNKVNRSEIARQMYPAIKTCSAAGKLHNKVNEKNRFRFTPEEELRIRTIVTFNFKR